MNKEEAIATIEQALNIATQKGAFNIADVEVILNALKALKQNEVLAQELKQEEPIP